MRKKPTRYSPLQLANQFNFAHHGRITGHCHDLKSIADRFHRTDLRRKIEELEMLLKTELEFQVDKIRKTPPESGRKGGASTVNHTPNGS